MSTPAMTLTFQSVEGALGAFGNKYEDITRPGAEIRRLRYVGKSGADGTLSAAKFYDTRADAIAGIAAVESAKGKEVVIQSRLLSNYRWRGFLQEVYATPPKAVVVSGTNYDWRVNFELSVMRTG